MFHWIKLQYNLSILWTMATVNHYLRYISYSNLPATYWHLLENVLDSTDYRIPHLGSFVPSAIKIWCNQLSNTLQYTWHTIVSVVISRIRVRTSRHCTKQWAWKYIGINLVIGSWCSQRRVCLYTNVILPAEFKKTCWHQMRMKFNL